MIRYAKISDARMKLSDKSYREICACVPPYCTPKEALEVAIKESDICYFDTHGVLFGINGLGNFFMFFGPVENLPLSFYKELKKFKKMFMERYGRIHSTILIDDEKVETKFEVRLAKFLGAKLGTPYYACGHCWLDWEMI